MQVRPALHLLAIVSSLLGSEGLARAEEQAPAEIPLRSAPPSAPPPVTTLRPAEGEPRARTEWYGWQTLTLDGATFVVAVAGSAAAKSPIPGLLACGFFVVSGSIVHGFRGRGSAALTSLALRAGIPAAGTLLGGLIGFVFTSGETNSAVGSGVFGALFGGAIGGGLGVLTASALDAALLGYQTVPDAEKKNSGLRFSPTVQFSPQGAHAGIAGTF